MATSETWLLGKHCQYGVLWDEFDLLDERHEMYNDRAEACKNARPDATMTYSPDDRPAVPR